MTKMLCTTPVSGKSTFGCYHHDERCCSHAFGKTVGVSGAHKRKRRYFKRVERQNWKRQIMEEN